MAALIKNSTTRRILLKHSGFAITSYVLGEIESHAPTIMRQSGLTDEVPSHILEMLLQNIHRISDEELMPHFNDATEIIGKIDPDDDHLIAAALAHPASIIWSEDKALKHQDRVTVMNTREIIAYLENSSLELR